MTWLYLPFAHPQRKPSMASPCVPDLAAWTSGWQLHNPDTELFVSSSGKPQLRPPSWRGWKMRPCTTRLSGMTLPALTARHGAGAFISSLPVIPASRSRLRASAKARTTRATSGRSLPGTSTLSSPNGYSLKMYPATSLWDFPMLEENYQGWATRLRRASLARLKRARAMRENACSWWLTPTASSNGNLADMQISKKGIRFVRRPGTGSYCQVSQGVTAVLWTLFIETLRAIGAWEGMDAATKHPCSHPIQLTLRHGDSSSSTILRYNPRFLDLLMGQPPGWTDAEVAVTGFAHWLRRSRGALSRLLTDFDPWPGYNADKGTPL